VPRTVTRRSPAERIRLELGDARRRGVCRDDAWREARSTALVDLRGEARRDWGVAIGWAKPYFRSGFLRDGGLNGSFYRKPIDRASGATSGHLAA